MFRGFKVLLVALIAFVPINHPTVDATATATRQQCSRTDCADQYESDSARCRKVPTAAGRARCWSSASERRAFCIRTGILDSPTLLTS